MENTSSSPPPQKRCFSDRGFPQTLLSHPDCTSARTGLSEQNSRKNAVLQGSAPHKKRIRATIRYADYCRRSESSLCRSDCITTIRLPPAKLYFSARHIHTPSRCVNMLGEAATPLCCSNIVFTARPLIIHYAFLIPHYTRNFLVSPRPYFSANLQRTTKFYLINSILCCLPRTLTNPS